MNIYEMAEQASRSNNYWLEHFAALVAAAARADEREACAKVCDDLLAPDNYSDTDKFMWDVTCAYCAEAILARGTT